MYIDTDIYEELTGRDPSECTDVRIRRASRLLDVRIGNVVREGDDGFKLDLTKLNDYQLEAVQMWVSWMVASLFINADSVQVNESVKLGRFSVNRTTPNNSIPDTLIFADAQLSDSCMVNRFAPTQRRDYEPGYYI